MSQADRIIEAAHTCFSRFGFNKTSMEDIAREAGLSRRSVYRHFPDKPALFREVMAGRTSSNWSTESNTGSLSSCRSRL